MGVTLSFAVSTVCWVPTPVGESLLFLWGIKGEGPWLPSVRPRCLLCEPSSLGGSTLDVVAVSAATTGAGGESPIASVPKAVTVTRPRSFLIESMCCSFFIPSWPLTTSFHCLTFFWFASCSGLTSPPKTWTQPGDRSRAPRRIGASFTRTFSPAGTSDGSAATWWYSIATKSCLPSVQCIFKHLVLSDHAFGSNLCFAGAAQLKASLICMILVPSRNPLCCVCMFTAPIPSGFAVRLRSVRRSLL
mmetsp:Transcript_11445/g.31806  ORF Transcript_11445/g.31806 Transcript_11445/m.31806 type:complete len:246 (+) Transcript_11445:2191-2928(+)